MSRLSRFKRDPEKKLSAVKSRFDEDDADSGDDFKTPKSKSKNQIQKEIKKPVNAVTVLREKSSPPSSSQSSFSEYFPIPPVKSKNAKNSNGRTKNKVETEKAKKISLDNNAESNSKVKVVDTKKQLSKTKEESTSKALKDLSPEKILQSESDSEAAAVPTLNPVLCPFCKKKLNDKLTSITHIKSCAKGISIEKIYEAILLQEKQQQEWKQLGIEFPTTTENKKDKPAAKARTGGAARGGKGGRGPRSKQDDDGGADPNLELALALSISLHEEVESRKQDRKIIENGALENEIEIVHSKVVLPGPSKPNKPSASITETVSKITSNSKRNDVSLSSSIKPSTKRRGKRIVYEKLPMATVDDTQKKNFIVDQLSRVYDEAQQNAGDGDFYIRDVLPRELFQVPESLKFCHNKSSQKWNAAKCNESAPSETFKVEGLFDESQSEIQLPFASPNDSEPVVDSACVGQLGQISGCSDRTRVGIASNRAACTATLSHDELKKSKNFKSKSSAICVSSKNASFSRRSSTLSSSAAKTLQRLPQIVRDVAGMLMSKIDCDLCVFGREEKPIKCHTFILQARCPKLLNEIVVEESGNELYPRSRNVIALTGYTHEAVKVFLWYLYTGTVESKDTKILDEVKTLAVEYDIVIAEDFKEEKKPDETATTAMREIMKSTDACVQTEITVTQDSATSTTTTTEDEVESHNICEKSIVLDGDDDNASYYSQELFTEFYETGDTLGLTDSNRIINKDNAVSNSSSIATNTEVKGAGVSYYEKDMSVELFEDEEETNHESANQQPRPLSSSPQVLDSKPADPSILFEVSNCNSILLDDSFGTVINNGSNVQGNGINETELLSPIVSPPLSHQNSRILFSWERKRQRSVSLSPTEDSLYTATAIASCWQFRQDRDEECNQVSKNKRQKLDFDDIGTSAIINDDENNSFNRKSKSNVKSNNDVSIIEVDIDEDDNELSKQNNINIVFDKTVSDIGRLENKRGSDKVNNSTPKIKKASLLPRSASTPDLTKTTNRASIHPISQQTSYNAFDPFDDGDDSVFANIAIPGDDFPVNNYPSPVILLSKSPNENIETDLRNHSISTPVTVTTPTNLRTRKKLSPRNLSGLSSDDFSVQPGKKKLTKKGTNKTQAKIKLPKKLPPPQPVFIAKDPEPAPSPRSVYANPSASSPPPLGDGCESELMNPKKKTGPKRKANCSQQPQPPSSSPMLNYSLIDTPVLKQELKRYGIKPLPRSKAKVLLRHIYKETHK